MRGGYPARMGQTEARPPPFHLCRTADVLHLATKESCRSVGVPQPGQMAGRERLVDTRRAVEPMAKCRSCLDLGGGRCTSTGRRRRSGALHGYLAGSVQAISACDALTTAAHASAQAAQMAWCWACLR